MSRPATCTEHGEYTERLLTLASKTIGAGCPECAREAKADRERRDAALAAEKAAREAKRRRVEAAIPPRFQVKTLDDYRADSEGQKRALAFARRYAEKFPERLASGGGLVFCGRPGTGKTHLAAAIANHVIERFEASVRFGSVISLVSRVKATYRDKSEATELDVLNEYVAPDLLILDEVGVQYGTDNERIILFRVMQARYEFIRPSILISNLEEDELADYLGERIMDRMHEGGGAVVGFDWDSWRRRS